MEIEMEMEVEMQFFINLKYCLNKLDCDIMVKNPSVLRNPMMHLVYPFLKNNS
jgi:hypothetical protein